MKSVWGLRLQEPIRRGALSLMTAWLAASVALAGPVLNDDGLDAGSARGIVGSPAAPGLPMRAGGATAGSAVDTGNKNLDLLLDLQTRAGIDAPAAAAPRPAGSSAPIDPRAQADQKATPGGAHRPALQSVEGLAAPETAIRAAPTVPRRDWTARPATDTEFSAGNPGDRGDARGTGSIGSRGDDDDFLRRLPFEVIQFLRENSYWLLGALAAVFALGAGLKAYSRRI